MIKKFIDRLLGNKAADKPAAPPAMPLGQRVDIPAEVHGINPALLDDNAVRVVRTLKEAGYEAYIVGGAVRDLLVNLRPKDFDVATDATPEQVKALFRRAFIIGRRFRLVHVVFGRGREHEVIEVSTFRAYMDPAATEAPAAEGAPKAAPASKDHAVDASGRVLRDNVWGPMIEDAARRDFSINAMYYDPLNRVVVDFHGGLADARARVLRMIGDPETRYREDPVRIIRVTRFAAKLGFNIEPATHRAIAPALPLLANVPISRLFDEMIKLLQTGHALRSIESMKTLGLLGGAVPIFPVLEAAFNARKPHPEREAFVRQALQNTDDRVADGRAVVPSFMLACMLWHDVQARWTTLRNGGEAPLPALQQAVDAVFDARIGDISGRGKLGGDMREIWLMQPRFERRTPSSAMSLVNQLRFRAGDDILRRRADARDLPGVLADWWEDFHLGSDEEREAMLDELKASQAGRRKGGAPKPARGGAPADVAPAPDAEGAEADSADDDGDDDTGEAEPTAGDGARPPARKRRRRRRKPGGAGGGAGGGASAA
ncbi:MAG: polynucleotide adenylyltransferase PcnB [Rubrivivax sp.]